MSSRGEIPPLNVPSFRADAGLTGSFNDQSIRKRPSIERNTLATAALVARGMMFQSSGWELCAVDIATKRMVWSTSREGGFSYTAVSGRILVAPNSSARDTHVYAFDTSTGHELWKWTQPKSEGDASGRIGVPTIAGGLVLIGGTHGLFGIDLRSGSTRWRSTAIGAISDPIAAGGRVAVATGADGLSAFDLDSGRSRWTLFGRHYRPLTDGRITYVATPNELIAVDLRSGSILWHTNVGMGADPPAPALAKNKVYVGRFIRKGLIGVEAIDAATGRKDWETPVDDDGFIASDIAVGGDVVYAGSESGDLFAFDAAVGKLLWRLPIEHKMCLADNAPVDPGKCNMSRSSLHTSLLQVQGGKIFVGSDPRAYPADNFLLYVIG